MRTMVYNMLVTRGTAVKQRELEYFGGPGGCDFIGINEGSGSGRAAIKAAASALGWDYFQPAEKLGQGNNAYLFNPHSFRLLAQRPVLCADPGYPGTNPRWAMYGLLESRVGDDAGERYAAWVVHYAPNWERANAHKVTPQRWRCNVETNEVMTRELREERRRHPAGHRLVMGDFNCRALSTARPEFPEPVYSALGMRSIWTPERQRVIRGTFGERHIDDMRHSEHVVVDRVRQETDQEGTDHNPPIVDSHLDLLLRDS